MGAKITGISNRTGPISNPASGFAPLVSAFDVADAGFVMI